MVIGKQGALFPAVPLAVLLGFAGGGFSPAILAADAADDAKGLAFFEKRIRPVLAENCYECHSAEAGKRKGGLHLDNRASLRAGGETGVVIDFDKLESSRLLTAISYHDAELQMPPEKRLPKAVVEDFRAWLEMGAPDPREGEAVAATGREGIDYQGGRRFWSFRPVEEVAVPEVEEFESEIDRFLEVKRSAAGLQSAAPAPRATLIRRLYFDLTGLPPSLEEVRAFEKDGSDDDTAVAALVDRLLASPAFGERWGRHWLDVVRFAESSGGGRAALMHEAWRFRDYVIEAFNADKPFDQLIREHLAGDLLADLDPGANADVRREQIVASGFLALAPTNYELQDKELLRMEVVDEQIDTTGRAFLGMTLGCARCHDHMFDPVSAKDYYALAGIFRSTDTLLFGNVSSWRHRPLPLPQGAPPLSAERKAEWDKFAEGVAKLEVEFAATESVDSRKGIGGKIISQMITKPVPVYEVAMSVREAVDAGDYRMAIRGDVHRLAEPVKRAFPEVMLLAADAVPLEIDQGASGRLQLADWIASPDHPLTARVFVNRIWQHLFGEGLVRTVDNFGATGETPSHPELLDWLAATFVEDGWSTKKMIRRVVLSDAYRASSRSDPAQQELDPENRLLARQNHRRLEAEVLRDSLLLLSGELDRTAGGKTMERKLGSEFSFDFSKEKRRSVYLPVFRNNMEGLFQVFDFANPNLVVGRRTESTIPSQVLYLMNSDFVAQRAEASVELALAMTSADIGDADDGVPAREALLDDEIVAHLFRHTFGRDPLQDEARRSYEFLQSFDESERNTALVALQQALFGSVDFRYVD